jgi:hypothetical protein
VHLLNAYAVDISWGGPHWQQGISSQELNGGGTSWRLLVAAVAISLTCLFTYLRIGGHAPTRLVVRRLAQVWARPSS